MKDTILKIRINSEVKEEFYKIVEDKNENVSKLLRKYIEGYIKRNSKGVK